MESGLIFFKAGRSIFLQGAGTDGCEDLVQSVGVCLPCRQAAALLRRKAVIKLSTKESHCDYNEDHFELVG